MATSYLFDPPQTFLLPLSKHRDVFFTFVHKPLVTDENGEPVLDSQGKPQYQVADFPGGATLTLEIDTDPITTADAVIDEARATVNINYLVADTIPAGVPWRLRMVVGPVDNVLAHGKTVRRDP